MMKSKCKNCGAAWSDIDPLEIFEQTDTGEDICPQCETAHIEYDRGLKKTLLRF